MKRPRGKKPERIDAALAGFLKESGLGAGVERAGVVTEWPLLVGAAIARVTEAVSVTPDGVLFIAVRTHAWMNELAMMEPQLLEAVNRDPARAPIKKLRFQLMR